MTVYLMNTYINVSVRIKHQPRLRKDLVLTVSFKAVMTGWTLGTFERREGQKVLPQLGGRHKMKR